MPDAQNIPSAGDMHPVDGLAPPQATPPAQKPMPQVQQLPLVQPEPPGFQNARKKVIIALGSVYSAYVLWCLALLMLLPSPTGEGQALTSAGMISVMIGVALLAGGGFFAFRRIAKANVSIALRQRSLLLLVLALIPGLAISVIVPFAINREPSLPLDVLAPKKIEDFVAPVSVTFSAERAAQILRNLGYRPTRYIWDTDGDGKANDDSLQPTTTVLYSKKGIFIASVRIILDGNAMRTAAKRVSIPTAVFGVTPASPIVEQPVLFSVKDLFADPKAMVDVTWDFGDGTDPELKTETDIAHTFYAIGDYDVSARVTTDTKAQLTFKKTVTVQNPPPLPFPVTVESEPKNLVGPAPFGALFQLRTTTPIKEVLWQFGDGKEERGADLRRVGHSYEKPGIFPLITRVRSQSGQLAELTTIVRVAQSLSLGDLRFEGNVEVRGDKINGDVPLKFALTPKTARPLVEFQWEYAPGTEAKVTGTTLEATYRREGIYYVTLVGQDADGKVMRKPITIQVTAPTVEPVIDVNPDGGTAPLTVTLDGSNSFIPPGEQFAGYRWNYGDDNSVDERSDAFVTHTYTAPGEYEVTLTIVTATGKEYSARRTIVVRKPLLSACFIPSRTSLEQGGGVEFNPECTAGTPNAYQWEVRYDAQPGQIVAQSPEERFVHVFGGNPGKYRVKLTVTDAFGNRNSKEMPIDVTPSP